MRDLLIMYENTRLLYAHTSILVHLILDSCLVLLSTLLETAFSVFDHPWTQDNPIFPLAFGGNTGPYIDQVGSQLKVLSFQSVSKL